MDPLIKSQLLYQLSYAPESRATTRAASCSKVVLRCPGSKGLRRAGGPAPASRRIRRAGRDQNADAMLAIPSERASAIASRFCSASSRRNSGIADEIRRRSAPALSVAPVPF